MVDCASTLGRKWGREEKKKMREAREKGTKISAFENTNQNYGTSKSFVFFFISYKCAFSPAFQSGTQPTHTVLRRSPHGELRFGLQCFSANHAAIRRGPPFQRRLKVVDMKLTTFKIKKETSWRWRNKMNSSTSAKQSKKEIHETQTSIYLGSIIFFASPKNTFRCEGAERISRCVFR